MKEDVSIFKTLNDIDVSSDTKQKQNLSYLPWASAWKRIKSIYPSASYITYPQMMDDFGNTRFWHDDGKTGWVDVGVIIDELECRLQLPVMDLRNNSIPAEKITSADANKAWMRCFVKVLAMHGLGLYIYEGEDVPESVAAEQRLKEEIKALIEKRCALSDKAKEAVKAACVEAERDAFPDADPETIIGNYRNIADVDKLEALKRKIMAIRK